MPDIKNIQVDGVDYAIKDETARNSIGDTSQLKTEATDLVSAVNELSGKAGPIQRIESLDESNLLNLRDLETGSYVLYGYFRPYPGASNYLPFDNLLVNVYHVAEGSHLFEFSTANSEVNFIEILVDSTAESGFTYSRTAINMLDLTKFAVQSDLAQNDPTQPDYVKGRTHWEENNQTVIEWDNSMDTSGSDSFEYGSSTFAKVSNIAPGVSELDTAIISMTANGNDQSFSVKEQYGDSSNWWKVQGKLIDFGGTVMIAYETDIGEDVTTTAIPSAGTYFNLDMLSQFNAEQLSLTYGSTTYHPLDEGFIPDSVARKTDVTWENLPDKPFEDNQNVIEWDGSTEGLDNIAIDNITFYKVSDLVPDLADVVNGTVEYYNDNEMSTFTLEEELVAPGDGCFCCGEHVVVVQKTECTLLDAVITAPSTGVYFVNVLFDEAMIRCSKLTYGSIKTIEGKFLPKLTAIADLTAAPTMEDFNNLLAVLRDAGYLATE